MGYFPGHQRFVAPAVISPLGLAADRPGWRGRVGPDRSAAKRFPPKAIPMRFAVADLGGKANLYDKFGQNCANNCKKALESQKLSYKMAAMVTTRKSPVPDRPSRDLVARTVEKLSARILAGSLKPEGRLPSQGELCDELGVSRSVIREAMRILQSRGLVDVSRGSRPRVTPPRRDTVVDSLRTYVQRAEISLLQLQEMRQPLEVEIATLAARRITPEKLDELRATVQALASARDREAQIDADIAFHRVLAEASGNPLFGIVLDVLADRLRESRRQTLAASGVQMALGYHRRILQAIEERDSDTARREMAMHMEQTRRDLENPPAKRP